MDFKKFRPKKYRILSSGKYFSELKPLVICPECASEVVKTETKIDTKWGPNCGFWTVQTTHLVYICEDCGCRFETKPKRGVTIYWGDFLKIFAVLGVIGLLILVYLVGI